MAFGIGPFQGPAGVQWGGGKIAVLEVASNVANRTDSNFNPNLTLLPWGTSYGLHSPSSVIYPATGDVPPILQIVTPAMKKFFYMWSYPLYSLRESALNPGGSRTSYYVWFNFGDAFPGVPPNDFENNISWDSTWDNEADANARAANLTAGGNPHHVETFELVTPPFMEYTREQRALVFFNLSKIATLDNVNTLFNSRVEFRAWNDFEQLDWTLRLRTYKGENTFPANGQNEPLWGTQPVDTFAAERESNEGTGHAFHVNLTVNIDSLDISGEVVRL